MKLDNQQKSKILFRMALRPTTNPFRKIKVRLLHNAMRGDERARRQLALLGKHYNAMCGK